MKTNEDRFWDKVQKTDGCWFWTACKIRGYGQFSIKHKPVSAHRFAYETMVGPIPSGMQIDHVCHNASCVNPAHMRLCDGFGNARNKGKYKTNTSGFKGVYWHKQAKNWHAQIWSMGQNRHLGHFDSAESAHEAYCRAAKILHGDFANYGGAQ